MEIQITSGASTPVEMKTHSTSSQDGNDVSEARARYLQGVHRVVALRRWMPRYFASTQFIKRKQKYATCSDGEN
jgi:hypothetical protein